MIFLIFDNHLRQQEGMFDIFKLKSRLFKQLLYLRCYVIVSYEATHWQPCSPRFCPPCDAPTQRGISVLKKNISPLKNRSKEKGVINGADANNSSIITNIQKEKV